MTSNLSIIQEAWLAYGARDSDTIRLEFDGWSAAIERPAQDVIADPSWFVTFYPSGEWRSFLNMAEALDCVCAMARQ